MKNLKLYSIIALLLLLTACQPVPRNKYKCILANAHGTYVRLTIQSVSKEEAVKQAELIRDRLAARNLIPNCIAVCYRPLD